MNAKKMNAINHVSGTICKFCKSGTSYHWSNLRPSFFPPSFFCEDFTFFSFEDFSQELSIYVINLRLMRS